MKSVNSLGIILVLVLVFCFVACSKSGTDKKSSSNYDNKSGETNSNIEGNSRTDGVKITITGFPKNMQDYLNIAIFDGFINNYDLNVLAEGKEEIINGNADFYLNIKDGEYYIWLFQNFGHFYTDGKTFFELGLATSHLEEDYSGNHEMVRVNINSENYQKLPTYSIKAAGNVIDINKFMLIPEYGRD